MLKTKDVHFETPRGSRSGYLALPSEQPRGSIVVVHEIFGRAPEIERATVRIAEQGYAALMPDLFGERFKPLCISQAMRELAAGRGEMIDVLRAAGDEVAKLAGTPRQKTAVIGFCLGGGLALAVGNAFAAVSSNYGDIPPSDVMRGIGPTIGCYAGRDRAFRKAPNLLRERLGALGVEPEVHVFENAGHAFLCDGDHPIASFFTRAILDVDAVRDAGVREQAWERIFAFFAKHT
jgi:carboxymethylenebutenolidase